MNIKERAYQIASVNMKNKCSPAELEDFAEALIESYKAELLKEVGEPVLYAEFAEDGGWLGDASEYADHLEEPHALFTSDQVAVAILKATKPLEDQLAAAQEANEHWQRATAENENKWIEANDKLAKAEQRVAEWQPIETAPKDGQSYLAYSTEFVNQYWVTDKCNGMTHWMPLPKAPANGGNS